MAKVDVIKSDIQTLINRHNCTSMDMGYSVEVTDYQLGYNRALEDVIRLLCYDMGIDLFVTFKKGEFREYEMLEIAE